MLSGAPIARSGRLHPRRRPGACRIGWKEDKGMRTESPMHLQIVSDLHLEFHEDEGAALLAALPTEGVDALILAADGVNPAPASVGGGDHPPGCGVGIYRSGGREDPEPWPAPKSRGGGARARHVHSPPPEVVGGGAGVGAGRAAALIYDHAPISSDP